VREHLDFSSQRLECLVIKRKCFLY